MRPGEWCAENGINVKTYYYWHNKIRKLVNQQTEFFEVPAAPGRHNVPVATIRVGIVEADIYPGADVEVIRAICQALKTYVHIFQNVKGAFTIDHPHVISQDIAVITLVNERKYGWKIFSIGERVTQYKESLSLGESIRRLLKRK